jgi:hypothetical protein
MKRTLKILSILTLATLLFGFGWFMNDMSRFAKGVKEDAKKFNYTQYNDTIIQMKLNTASDSLKKDSSKQTKQISPKNNKVTISVLKNNIFYAGPENPFEISVENINSKNILIEPSSGEIKRSYNTLAFTTKEAGQVIFYIYYKDSTHKIFLDKFYFKVKKLPWFEMSILGQKSGFISASRLKACEKIDMRLGEPFEDFNPSNKMISYNCCIITKDSTYRFNQVKGQLITQEIKEVFETLEKGDNVLFYNPTLSMPFEMPDNAILENQVLLTIK